MFTNTPSLPSFKRTLAALWVCTVAVTALHAAEPVTASKTYTVRAGDTLDKVIRQTMPDSPLRIELLRDAFAKQNPQAFTQGPNKVLMANAVLTIPNQNELVQKTLVPFTLATASNARPHASGEDSRKLWVRYP